LTNDGAAASLYVNVEGVSSEGYLQVELIDQLGTAIDGYSGTQAAAVKEPGLKLKVTWPGKAMVEVSKVPARLRFTFAGPAAHAIKFYAAYLE
jgi:hypothetical protein